MDQAAMGSPAGDLVERGQVSLAPEGVGTSAPSLADIAQFARRSIARRIMTDNPFYVASCALVLYGLRATLTPARAGEPPLIQAGIMVVYTLLVASCGYWVIRRYRVWDDARSILLVVVLLFLALSTLFDDLIIARPRLGIVLLLSSLAFAFAVSGGLLRALGIGLGPYYREGFLLFLVVFHAFPIGLGLLARAGSIVGLAWTARLFPLACGAIMLLLLPAARRGPSSIEGNGTPWTWPLYPGALFFVIGLGVCLRHYLFSLAFVTSQQAEWRHEVLFLAPFLLAAAMVLLEVALCLSHGALAYVLMAMPAAMVYFIALNQNELLRNDAFRVEVTRALASPIFLILWSAILFYLWAGARGAKGADWLASVFLLGAVFVPSTALTLTDTTTARWFPLATLAVLHGILAIARPAAPRILAASVFAILAASAAFRGTPFAESSYAFPWHLLMIGSLLIGGLCRDAYARVIQYLALAMLVASSLRAWYPSDSLAKEIPTLLTWVYIGVIAGVEAWYGRQMNNRSFLHAAKANLVLLAWEPLRSALLFLTPRGLPRGFWATAGGFLVLGIAARISHVKGTRARRLVRAAESLCEQNAAASDERGPDGSASSPG